MPRTAREGLSRRKEGKWWRRRIGRAHFSFLDFFGFVRTNEMRLKKAAAKPAPHLHSTMIWKGSEEVDFHCSSLR
jgi:hypothetical protein